MNIGIKVLLIVSAIIFVLNIDAGWRDQWVWFKSFFSGFSIKKPTVTRKQMVIGGVGALAVAGAAWWWFNKPSQKGPIQKNDSQDKQTNIEKSSFNNDAPLQPVVQDSKEFSNIISGETIIIQDVNQDKNEKQDNPLLSKEEIISKEEDIPQKTQNPDLIINKSTIKEKKNEEKAKIAQSYQEMNEMVDIKEAIKNFQKLIDAYEKQEKLTDAQRNNLKTQFQKLNSNIPKDQKLLWTSITKRYTDLIKK